VISVLFSALISLQRFEKKHTVKTKEKKRDKLIANWLNH